MDTGKRLARLEEQLYFQEHAIQELNDALLAQQRQMDAMEHALKIMAEREQKLLDMLADRPENAMPPHSHAGTILNRLYCPARILSVFFPLCSQAADQHPRDNQRARRTAQARAAALPQGVRTRRPRPAHRSRSAWPGWG